MRNTLKIFAAAAMALTSTIGMAQQPGEHRFTHEGSTYVYTSTTKADGRTVVAGHRLPLDEPFRLVIDGERVSGVSNGTPVSFRTASAKGAARKVEIAAK